MFNPWLILAVFLAIGAAGITGYWKGVKDERADQIEAQHEAVVAGISAANELAKVDLDAAVAAERSRRLAAENRGKQAQSLADALAKAPKPVCDSNQVGNGAKGGGGDLGKIIDGHLREKDSGSGQCRIGPDALRLLNDTLTGPGDRPKPPGGSDGPVPRPRPDGERQAGDGGAAPADDGGATVGV